MNHRAIRHLSLSIAIALASPALAQQPPEHSDAQGAQTQPVDRAPSDDRDRSADAPIDRAAAEADASNAAIEDGAPRRAAANREQRNEPIAAAGDQASQTRDRMPPATERATIAADEARERAEQRDAQAFTRQDEEQRSSERADGADAGQPIAARQPADPARTTGAERMLQERPGQSAVDARREAVIWTSYALTDALGESDLEVHVTDDMAVLSGTVESQVERELAEEIALSVQGIARVDNRIRIDPAVAVVSAERDVDLVRPAVVEPVDVERSFRTALADAATTARVKSRLLWNTATDGLDIDVDTRWGRVILTGTADGPESLQMAERLARDTDGVVDVQNKLTVIPDNPVATGIDAPEPDIGTVQRNLDAGAMLGNLERPDPWITTKVRSALLYSRGVDGFDIDVSTRDGVVELGGMVRSEAERDRAVELARGIVGVREVDASDIRIAPDRGAVAGGEYE